MSFRSLLDSTVTIKRPTVTRDDIGGVGSTAYATLYSNVPCRFESAPKKQEIIAYDKNATYPDYFIYMEWRSGIQESDVIFKGSRQFEITLIENWSEQDKYMQISVVEVGRD